MSGGGTASAVDVVTTQDPVTGLVSRTVAGKLGEFVSVKDFGALGDNLTNDTAAIALAVATLNTPLATGSSLNSTAGRTLYFPPGTYINTSPHTLRADNVRIVGTGAQIINTQDAPAFIVGDVALSQLVTICVLDGLVIRQNGAGPAITFAHVIEVKGYSLNIRKGANTTAASVGLRFENFQFADFYACKIADMAYIGLDIDIVVGSVASDHFNWFGGGISIVGTQGATALHKAAVLIRTYSDVAVYPRDMSFHGVHLAATDTSQTGTAAIRTLHYDDVATPVEDQTGKAVGTLSLTGSCYIESAAMAIDLRTPDEVGFDAVRFAGNATREYGLRGVANSSFIGRSYRQSGSVNQYMIDTYGKVQIGVLDPGTIVAAKIWSPNVDPQKVLITDAALLPAGASYGDVRDNAKGAPYTLTAADNGRCIVCTAAITITVPASTVLGSGFRCDVYAKGFAVTLTGAAGSINLVSGEIATVAAIGGTMVGARGVTSPLVAT